MSLVGPVPVTGIGREISTMATSTLAVPQGMTGWWQINGRSDKPMHLHTEDDLYYINHYSIWLDIEIGLRTIWIAL